MNISVELDYTKVVNFAMQQNRVPLIRSLSVKNSGDADVNDLTVSITSELDFMEPWIQGVAAVPAGGKQALALDDVMLSAKFFAELTERIESSFTVTVKSGDEDLCSQSFPISLLAFDEWPGLSVWPQLTASFVTPNHPAIVPVLKRAAEILGKWTGSPALDEYQTRDPNRVKMQMVALYEAVNELQITYITPPAGFENSGQRLRLCDAVLSTRFATCIDMTLFYASCLEQMGLNPLIVMVKGHAFVGAWLVNDTFADAVNDDPSMLSKRCADGISELLVLESTCMSQGVKVDFDKAVEAAVARLSDVESFEMFIDVVRARLSGIRPLPLRTVENGVVTVEESDETPDATAPKSVSVDAIVNENQIPATGKQQIWERKLLDLSLRNNLLNTRPLRILQIATVAVDKIEDAFADGKEFEVQPNPGGWVNANKVEGLYRPVSESDPMAPLFMKELESGRLRAYYEEDKLKTLLTSLYRSSRLSVEENGANTLYMAIGMLRWREDAKSVQSRFSPIMLMPIEIVRSTQRRGYVIRARDENTTINVTLLEMLRQFFGIRIAGLEELPTDESGVDVRKVFSIVRQAIMDQPGWDVEEQAVIGNFSFNKFIMWNDIHNNADKLARNKIVSSLMSGKVEWNESESAVDGKDLDEEFGMQDVALPLSSDSSQLSAIIDAVANRSFILHGPPGTGKSQTITNIIANALYNGKKVLFVAEKMAALSVVQRRLEKIGLAPFCLELHSNKAKKSAVLEQLKRTTEVAKTKSNEQFKIEAEQINALRRDINQYIKSLHKQYGAGLSLYDCFAGYETHATQYGFTRLPDQWLERLTKEQLAVSEGLVSQFVAACTVVSTPGSHPLLGIHLTKYSPSIKSEATAALEALQSALSIYDNAAAEVCDLFGIDGSALNEEANMNLVKVASAIIGSESLPNVMINSPEAYDIIRLTQDASTYGKQRDDYRNQLMSQFDSGITSIDVESVRSEWRRACDKWFLPKFFAKRSVLKSINQYAKGEGVNDENIEATLDLVGKYQTSQADLMKFEARLSPVLGMMWNGGNADWAKVDALVKNCSVINHGLSKLVNTTEALSEVKTKLTANLSQGVKAYLGINGTKLQQLIAASNSLCNTLASVRKVLACKLSDASQANWGGYLTDTATKWHDNIDSLHDWVTYMDQCDVLSHAGLSAFIDGVEANNVTTSDILTYYKSCLYRSYAEMILEKEPQMNSFHAVMFEEKIERFKQMSERFEKLTRQELFATLAASFPALQKEAAQTSEVGILQRNIRNGGRGMSIRRLFDNIPDLIYRMCPCMLMSPLSVAQYIDANNSPFDLVIFDEASQMPTCEAVGAIARGKNVIVVGDPNQMPPTNFFGSNQYDEENADKEDLESILDDCLALSVPSRHLLWHYRSKHESLIAFSNMKYYENKLLTFPSPDDLSSKVTFQHVPKGVYDRGRTRQNRAEAEAVVAEIKRRLEGPDATKRSIGVVTFNTNQQGLIEDLLNDLFSSNPQLEKVAMECEEPIFVKNLENVQGDERDIILFSVGFGPDREGRVTLNFGPLNRDGGWRRLNVAVSRARYEMMVFSTLRADDIDLNRTSAEGVAGLKSFLDYAAKGRQVLNYGAGSNGEHTKDGLVNAVAEELRKHGLEVVTNIGSSGYRVDMGIVNPNDKSRYVLGVIFDGYNYSSSPTVHDREITQPSVLTMLGWRLMHLWAMDWWENRTKIIDAIVKEVNDAIAGVPQPEAKPMVQPLKAAEPMPAEADPEPETDPNAVPYKAVKLPIKSIGSDDFVKGACTKQVQKMIGDILAVEAPVTKNYMCRRILNAFGITRMGVRVSAYLDDVLAHTGLSTDVDAVYWSYNQNPDTYSLYRPQSDRDARDIVTHELCNAATYVLRTQISLPYDDLVREVAHIFGIARVAEAGRKEMARGVEMALQKGIACNVDGKVKLK